MRAVSLGLVTLLGSCAEPTRLESEWQVSGRTATVVIDATSAAAAADIAQEMEQVMLRVDRLVDPTSPDSEIHRLNRQAADEPYSVQDRDLYICLKHALDYAQLSRGAFDPTAGALNRLYERARSAGGSPSDEAVELALERVGWARLTLFPESRAVRLAEGLTVDLRTMASGLALDLASRTFSRAGSRGGLLALDGALLVWGTPLDADQWEVELPDPRAGGAALGRVRLENRGIGIAGRPPLAPDGTVQVVDPRTGRALDSDVVLAVAIAEGAADASALAAALRAGGSLRAGSLLSKTNRVEALLIVDPDGKPYVLASASLRGRFEPSDRLVSELRDDLRFILPPERIDLPGSGL